MHPRCWILYSCAQCFFFFFFCNKHCIQEISINYMKPRNLKLSWKKYPFVTFSNGNVLTLFYENLTIGNFFAEK